MTMPTVFVGDKESLSKHM